MTGTNPVIRRAAYCLAHVPDLVRYGSKPSREIALAPSFDARLTRSLRGFEAARRYPPNQTFIGNLSPEALGALPRPWFEAASDLPQDGPLGEIIDQDLFYALLMRANVLEPE